MLKLAIEVAWQFAKNLCMKLFGIFKIWRAVVD